MKRESICRMAFAVLVAIVMLSTQSRAQDGDKNFKVGDRIEYQDNSKYDPPTSSYPVVWKKGTVIKLYPDTEQALIRWDKDPNYPNGWEQAYSIDKVRHITARPPVNPPVGDNDNKDNNVVPPAREPAGNGKGVMTHEEILGYMLSHGFINGQPKRDVQVCKDLIEQIKLRGVTSRLEVYKDDLSPYYSNGCVVYDDVVAATTCNIGTPTTNNWLFDTWMIYVIGGTVDTAPGDGYIYRKNESIAKMGFLTINSNGTYTWKVYPSDPPASYLKGTWRNATKVEMGLQGGAGIVLHQGQRGADWIMYKLMDPAKSSTAERVEVENMEGRGGDRFIGWRR
jgi:hypothetical protein